MFYYFKMFHCWFVFKKGSQSLKVSIATIICNLAVPPLNHCGEEKGNHKNRNGIYKVSLYSGIVSPNFEGFCQTVDGYCKCEFGFLTTQQTFTCSK